MPTTLEPDIPDGGRIDVRVPDAGIDGAPTGGENAAARVGVLRDREPLLAWRARQGTGAVEPDVPDVAFGFAPSSAHDIRVAGARGDDPLLIDVLSVVPGDGCAEDQGVGHPRALARLPVAGRRVVFVERVEARPPCGAGGRSGRGASLRAAARARAAGRPRPASART